MAKLPPTKRWDSPPRVEGFDPSVMERLICDDTSGLNECRAAIKSLDRRARKVVEDANVGKVADFVHDQDERGLLDKLMSKRMPAKVMIMGEMNCGKSMLLNTLLRFGDGTKRYPGLLPTTNQPCTLRITLLKYSETPVVTLHGSRESDKGQIETLARAWT